MSQQSKGVHVHISLANSNGGSKSSRDTTLSHTELLPSADTPAASTGDSTSHTRLLWLLFAVGWLFMPCWWAGVVLGLKLGPSAWSIKVKQLPSSQKAAWRACLLMSVLSALAVVLAFSISYGRGRPPAAAQEYFCTIQGPPGSFPDPSAAKTDGLPAALHRALQLPKTYPTSNIHVWFVEPAATTFTRVLLQDDQQQQQQQQRQVPAGPTNNTVGSDGSNSSRLVIGMQLLPWSSMPDAATVMSNDAATAVLLQLVVVGFVDAAAVGKLTASFEDEWGNVAQPQQGGLGGGDFAAADELLQSPPRPLSPGACTCRLGWDSQRYSMDCPSPWDSPAGTSQVPPALQLINGALVEQQTGKPATLHGVNWFGWNTGSLNFDGLWAYCDDKSCSPDGDIPPYESVGDEGAQQLLNISWWGKRRMTNDFAAVVYRIKLLGFNAVRVQFRFKDLNMDLPGGADPEFFPCLYDSDEYIGIHKTLDPKIIDAFGSQQSADNYNALLPKYKGMQHPPPKAGNPQCDNMPWSAPFLQSYVSSSGSSGNDNSSGIGDGILSLTMCNWYLPQGPGVQAVHRFLWQLQYLVSQGFYVLLDFASERAIEPNLQSSQVLAQNWGNLWGMISNSPGYQDHLAGRIFPDLVNEPSRWDCQWQSSCSKPNATRTCAPILQSYGLAAAAIWKQDPAVPIFINGLGQNHNSDWDWCGGNFPGMQWGDGFITNAGVVQQYSISNPSSLFETAAKMSGPGLVLAPHLYPSSITRNPIMDHAAVAVKWDLSWGLKLQGLDTNTEGDPLPALPVVIGEVGAKDYGNNSAANTDTTQFSAEDMQWLSDTAAYLRGLSDKTGRPMSWLWWAWNANSGDTQGLVGPGNTWREVQWTKVRLLTHEFGLRPWYCSWFPDTCQAAQAPAV